MLRKSLNNVCLHSSVFLINLILGRALDFSTEIDAFAGSNRDLHGLELDKNDWEAISLVANWLKAFRSATTEMSRTKRPMISTVHAIFRGLQDHLKDILRNLPDSTMPQLRDGLVAAHHKLSEYYYRSDESPYYTWAASMSLFLFIYVKALTTISPFTVLDPRIMYQGLLDDFSSEPELQAHLESAKASLEKFYLVNYACAASTSSSISRSPSSSSVTSSGSPQKINFTSRYQRKDRVSVNELEEYFKLSQEDFDTCEPLHWWRGRRSQFPNLYRLVCDIFSIPGE